MSPALPDYSRTAAALRVTTERLAAELATPTATAPAWGEFEWDVARAVATMHGISVLLAHRLRFRGPARWQRFLVTQADQGVARDTRIGALISDIDARLRTSAVRAIALKGAALRALDLYAPGERPMGDIDLLARAEDFAEVERALAPLGYSVHYRMERHVVFADRPAAAPGGFGEHVDNPLKIELHARIAEALPVTRVDITHWLTRGLRAPGLDAYPSRAALLAHLLLHAAGNMRAQAVRLIQLKDITSLAARFGAADWDELLHANNSGLPWWALPPLLLAQRCFPVDIPARVVAGIESRCEPALRAAARALSLHDASWSNLRIAALPGLYWSGSFVETLRYARTRLLPSRRALGELEVAADAQPQGAAMPWYRQSHGRRVARWLFSRPPRVQTMSCVLAALAPDER
jgi:hypothetical protein